MFSVGADMFPHREVFLRGEVAFSTHVDMFSTGEISTRGEVASPEMSTCVRRERFQRAERLHFLEMSTYF